MCGIAGYLGPLELEQERLDECLARMRRRGPDASGVYRGAFGDRRVCLLNTRLAIIDLDPRSNQPFRAGSKLLTTNGELYNYVELRDRLDVPLTTDGDTEVLANLLAERGPEALSDCEGMWAFALWDEADGTLVLSRDRIGEKPLYLYEDSTGLYFGSEVKFITALLGRRLDVNYDHVYRHLVNGYKSLYKAGHTFFTGLRELPPGTYLRVGEAPRRYWSPSFEQDASMAYGDAVEAVRERLVESVSLRLRSDVPLAFLMAGGIDTNSLVGIATRVLGHDVHAFTLVNTDERYGEQELVEHAVAELGIRHTNVPVTSGDFLENLFELVRQHDAPVYTISYYVQWLLMKEIARQGYKVSISGTGGDELFSGYYDHHNLYLRAVHGTDRYASALAEWEEHVRPLVRNPHLQRATLYVDEPGFREHVFFRADEFAGYLARDWSEAFAEGSYTDDLLRNRMLNELFHETVPPILHEDDLNAMYYSIENRSPFFDSKLMELAWRIPTPLLVRSGYAKAVLRDAMRGLVSDRILDSHRKVGFNAPVLDFIDVHDPETRVWLLDDGPIYDHVRRDKVAALIEKPDLPNSESKLLFNLVCAKAFLEEFA